VTNSNGKPRKPSRAVKSRQCPVCASKFRPHRRDALYCSGTCRQRALRARNQSEGCDLDGEIEAARLRYWGLVKLKAESTSVSVSQVMTAQSQFVDADGNVYMGGGKMGGIGEGRRLVGKVADQRPGWHAWGLEAAGAPFVPPTGRNSEGPRRAVAATEEVRMRTVTDEGPNMEFEVVTSCGETFTRRVGDLTDHQLAGLLEENEARTDLNQGEQELIATMREEQARRRDAVCGEIQTGDPEDFEEEQVA
jgi:hypothetical protein